MDSKAAFERRRDVSTGNLIILACTAYVLGAATMALSWFAGLLIGGFAVLGIVFTSWVMLTKRPEKPEAKDEARRGYSKI